MILLLLSIQYRRNHGIVSAQPHPPSILLSWPSKLGSKCFCKAGVSFTPAATMLGVKSNTVVGGECKLFTIAAGVMDQLRLHHIGWFQKRQTLEPQICGLLIWISKPVWLDSL